MSIIEFVHLTLPPPHTTTSASLLSTIPPACQVMGAASGLPSIFFADLLDESKMYVIGGWPSQEAHQHGFNGSAEQAKLIEGIKGVMDIAWMEYFDLPIHDLGEEGRLAKPCVIAVIWKCTGIVDDGPTSARGPSAWFFRDCISESRRAPVGYNLKKKETETEDDYLVLFEGFDGLKEGREAGGRVVRGMEEHGRGQSVKVVYMRRIDVEGNGTVS